MLLLLALFTAAPAKAPKAPPTEILFGEIAFSNQPGVDVMRMPGCSEKRSWNRPVSALSLDLRGQDRYLWDIRVQVEGGPDQIIEIRGTLTRGERRQDFALDGPVCITYLELLTDRSKASFPPQMRQAFRVYGKLPPPAPPPTEDVGAAPAE